MLDEALRNADAILDACRRSRVTLGYAENFVYAPAVAKLRRLIAQSGGAVLDLRAEESHSGSHAEYSRRWATAGGGSLLRMGSHPIGAVIHLTHYEGQVKHGRRTRSCRSTSIPTPRSRCTRPGRELLAGPLLARETVEVIYAAYVSAQEGRRVDLPGRRAAAAHARAPIRGGAGQPASGSGRRAT